MKLKDIKDQLHKETGENTPDVLDNVKVSPINKLKKNEKSLVVFKKTMATLILVFLLAILVVLSIAIHSLVVQDSGAIHFTFLSLRVYDGTDQNGLESEDLRIYNFILDDDGRILLAYDESNHEKLPTPREFDDILDTINYDGESTIYLIGASDGPADARKFAGGVEDCMLRSSAFDDVKVVSHINNSLSKSILSKSLSSLPGFDSSKHNSDKVNEQCSIYLTLVD